MVNKAGISARLRQAVEGSGCTRQVIADRAGINCNTLRNYMDYGTMPGAGKLAALCQALGVSADWVLGIGGQRPGRPTDMLEKEEGAHGP